MRPGDYNATHMVKAVKGLPLHPNAYATVQVNGVWIKVRENNKQQAVAWFAEWAAKIVDDEASRLVQTVLVPIPNSSAKSGTPPNFKTALLAHEIAKRCKSRVAVAPSLRWKTARPKSSDAASRRPELLYPELLLEGTIPLGRIVLIDDVYTTGGHVIASAWRLSENGRTVQSAICCGQTAHVQVPNPFQRDTVELEVPERP